MNIKVIKVVNMISVTTDMSDADLVQEIKDNVYNLELDSDLVINDSEVVTVEVVVTSEVDTPVTLHHAGQNYTVSSSKAEEIQSILLASDHQRENYTPAETREYIENLIKTY